MNNNPELVITKRVGWSLGMLLFPAFVILYILRYYVDLTFWDEWTLVPFIDKALSNHGSLSDWTAPYMGHRLILNKLVYGICAYGFAGYHGPIVLAQYAIQLVLLTVLIRALHRVYPFDSRAFQGLSLICSAVLFAPALAGIWLWGFAIQQPLTTLSFTLSVFLFCNSSKSTPTGWISLLACAGMASAASGNGLVVWPTLWALSFFKGSSFKTKIALTLLSLAVILLYFYHMPLVPKGLMSTSWSARILYILTFTGSLFSGGRLEFARIWGLGGLALYALNGVIFLRSSPALRQQVLPWIALPILSIASAFAGSFTRMAFGFGLDSRYLAISGLFWIGSLISFVILTDLFTRARWRAGILSALFFLGSIGYLRNHNDVTLFANMMNDVRLSEEAIHNGCYLFKGFPKTYTTLFPTPQPVVEGLAILKRHRLHPFVQPSPPSLIGANISTLGPVISPSPVKGEFTFLDAFSDPPTWDLDPLHGPISPAVEANGLIDSRARLITRIVLADEQGLIFGVGQTNYDPFDFWFWIRPHPPGPIHWRAFVKQLRPGNIPLRAYIQLSNPSRLAPLDQTLILR